MVSNSWHGSMALHALKRKHRIRGPMEECGALEGFHCDRKMSELFLSYISLFCLVAGKVFPLKVLYFRGANHPS